MPLNSQPSTLNLRAGRGVGITKIGDYFAMNVAARGRGKHRWFTSPAWNSQAGQWFATVKPGFVNHRCPIVRTTVQEQVQWDFGTNPLTGRPYFSDSVFEQPSQPAARIIDIPLYAAPAIPLNFRPVGFDGAPGDGVPEFFRNLGAADRPRSRTDAPESAGVELNPAPPAGLRLLRACDLILHQPRLALTSSITLQPGPVTGISNVTQTLGVRSAPGGDTLRVLAGRFDEPIGIDPIAGDYEEATWDELLISTVFLLSPRGTSPGSEPDGRWTPYVRHQLFWNLAYHQPPFALRRDDPGVPFIPPLAGGAAQIVINFLTASINDMTNQALNILTSHSLAGTFWTATGGGHDASFPSVATAPARGGLDKATRLAREASAAAARKRATRLDPPFPYRARAFSTSLLAA